MYKRKESFSLFFVFLIFSIFLFALSKYELLSFLKPPLENLFSSLGQPLYSLTNFSFVQKDLKIKELEAENKVLFSKLKDYQGLKNENKALNDQFQTSSSKNLNLLPSDVVGSSEKNFILNKGAKDGIRVGQGVISKDFAVGKITKVSENLSVVTLIINTSSSFPGVDLETNALGVVKGNGEDLTLSETLLSENLKVSDTIITKGDMNENGVGFSPNLIVGKILAVDKDPSALFQSAKIKSPIDFSKLAKVFIVLGMK